MKNVSRYNCQVVLYAIRCLDFFEVYFNVLLSKLRIKSVSKLVYSYFRTNRTISGPAGQSSRNIRKTKGHAGSLKSGFSWPLVFGLLPPWGQPNHLLLPNNYYTFGRSFKISFYLICARSYFSPCRFFQGSKQRDECSPSIRSGWLKRLRQSGIQERQSETVSLGCGTRYNSPFSITGFFI